MIKTSFKNRDSDSNSFFHQIVYLRAIAVLSIIGYHFSPSLFKSGFLGVDVFFVISGFLMIKILEDLRGANERNIFKTFVKNRILRIFPALVFAVF
jgi:peptidoglycan/LPS O-acetylase OafA/YrhL